MRLLRISLFCVLLSLLLMLLGAPLASVSGAVRQETDGNQKAASTFPPDSSVPADDQILFPELKGNRIQAVSVRTPERSFEFRCDSESDVSVNGHLADEEIFCTLVSQIQEFPVDDMHAFALDPAPLLTLVISTADGEQHMARFYSGGNSGAQAHIASGPADALTYHQTDAWRVGTLMMTCEGTRIQDESGNEIPVD